MTDAPRGEPASPQTIVKPSLTEDGYVFETDNGGKAGPYNAADLEAIDFDARVAERLRVKPGDVFRARLKMPDPRLRISSEDNQRKFVAEAGQGPEVPSSGFIMFEDDDWIAAEATYLFGQLTQVENVDTKFEKLETTECLQRVLFYNQKGARGVKLADDAVFKTGAKFLRPTSRTLGGSGPPTLMSLETGQRFLSGETVSVSDLHGSVVRGLKQFSNLDWNKRLYDVAACITIASYFYDLFGIFPIIVILGPFETGKGRLLLSICYMGHRGMPILDPSEASVFRTAEAWKGFLCIDEFYQIGPAIERLLRATYKKGMKVPRIEKSKSGVMTLGLFEVFGKIAIAAPDSPPPNITSKAITVKLRKMPDPNPEKRDPEPRDFENIRAKAYLARLTWPLEVKHRAAELDKQGDLGLTGRDYEVWKPILTIAKMLGGDVWRNVLEFAGEQAGEKRQDSYPELREVLEAIYELIGREKQSTLGKEKEEGKVPCLVEFTPKQLYDIVWERLKGQYRTVKQKQETKGESSEAYDYDTQSFQRVYSTQRIGQSYLRQLTLKGEHRKRGSIYKVSSGKEFDELVTRYHPGLPDQEGDAYYKRVGVEKPVDLEKPSQPSQVSPGPDLNGEKGGPPGDTLMHGDTQGVTDEPGDPQAITANPGDTQGVTGGQGVTGLGVENKRENGVGDTRDTRDGFSGHTSLQPPFVGVGTCTHCNGEGLPLRPDLKGEFPICQPCFDELSREGS